MTVAAAWIESGSIYSKLEDQSGKYWIRDGWIFGPKNSGKYWISDGWISGPTGQFGHGVQTGFWIDEGWIYGPVNILPFAQD
jgi:hypothetical protein